MSLPLGDLAPNFTTQTSIGEIDFYEYLGGSWGVLFSHPADFTPVCTTEPGKTALLKGEFDKRNVKALALSADLLDKHIGGNTIVSDGTPALKMFFRKRNTGICHVHGVWWHSKGTVLDNMDYERVAQEESLQQDLKNSMSSSEVLLFVGTGAGRSRAQGTGARAYS